MHQVVDVTTYTLPTGALCLTKNGWREELEEIVLEIGGFSVDQAMIQIWSDFGGLLGEGTLTLQVLARTPRLRGYLVFLPS